MHRQGDLTARSRRWATTCAAGKPRVRTLRIHAACLRLRKTLVALLRRHRARVGLGGLDLLLMCVGLGVRVGFQCEAEGALLSTQLRRDMAGRKTRFCLRLSRPASPLRSTKTLGGFCMEPPVALAAAPYSPSDVSMKTLQVSGSWSFSGNRL